MSVNRPYEEDGGIFSTLVSGGIVGGGLYGAYRVKTDGLDSTINNLTKGLNKIFPLKNDPTSVLQQSILDANTIIRGSSSYAMERQRATYAARREGMVQKINAIKSAGGKFTKITAATSDIDTVLNVLPKVKTFKGIGINSLEDISVFSGNKIKIGNEEKLVGQELVNAIGRLNGIQDMTGRVAFDGSSTISLDLGVGKPVKLQIPQYDEVAGWVTKNGATHRSAGYKITNIKAKDGEMIGAKVVDPVQYLLDTFSDMEASLAVSNNSNPALARDVLEMRRSTTKDIEAIAKKEASRIVNTTFDEYWKFQRLIKNVENGYQYITGGNIKEFIRDSKRVEIAPIALHRADQNGFPGLAEQVLSLGKMNYVGNTPANAIEGRSIDALSRLTRNIRTNPANSEFLMHAEEAEQVSKWIGYTLAQSPTAKGGMSFFPTHTAGFHAESQKSYKEVTLTKTKKFVDPISGKNIYYPKSMYTPTIWSSKVEALNPVYHQNLRTQGLRTVLGAYTHTDSLPEGVEIASLFMDNQRAERQEQLVLRDVLGFDNYDKGKLKANGIRTKVRVSSYYQDASAKTRINTATFNSLGDLLNNHTGALQGDIASVFIPKGTAIGAVNPSMQINTQDSLTQAFDIRDGVVYTKRPIRMTGHDLSRTLQELKIRGENDSIALYYTDRDAVTKWGTYGGAGRGTYTKMSPRAESSMVKTYNQHKLSQLPIANISGKYLEDVMPYDIIQGKGRGEMLSWMQQMLHGHALGIGDVYLDEELYGQFTKIINKDILGNANTRNIGTLAREGLLSFDQHATSIEEALSITTRILGGIRGEWDSPGFNGRINLSGKSWTRDKAAEALSRHLNDFEKKTLTKPLLTSMTLMPHETTREIGQGSNLMRIGVNERIQGLPRSVLEEVFKNNIVNSSKILEEGDLMMRSMGDEDLRSIFSQKNIPHLDADGLNKMLGSADDLTDLYSIVDSHLNPEKNPLGFTVSRYDGGLDYFSSGDTYSASQYLNEEERAALEEYARIENKVLQEAKITGEISEEGHKTLVHARNAYHFSSKGGYLKNAAARIENSWYNKNAFLPDIFNKSMVSKIPQDHEFSKLVNNMSLIDEETWTKSIRNEIDEAIEMAKQSTEGTSVNSTIRRKLGNETIFEDFIKPDTGIDNINSAKIAKEITERQQGITERIINSFHGGNFDEAAALLKENAIAMLLRRDPSIYAGSYTTAMAMPAPKGTFVKGGRFIASGDGINALIRGDFDGDPITLKLLYGNKARAEVMSDILSSRRTSMIESMTSLKKDREIVDMLFGNSSKAFKIPTNQKDWDLMINNLDTESESFKAAVITKGTTGSAHVKTVEYKSAMAEKLLQNTDLNFDETLHAYNFAMNFASGNIEQGTISGKQTSVLFKDGEAIQRIDSIISNIGKLDRETMLRQIIDLGGDTGPFALQAAIKLKGKANVKWLSANPQIEESILPTLNTVTNLRHKWKRETPENVRKMYQTLGYEEKFINERVAQYQEMLKRKDIIFKNEDPNFQKAFGINEDTNLLDYMEQLQKERKHGFDSAEAVLQKAQDQFERKAFGLDDTFEAAIARNTKGSLLRRMGIDMFVDPLLHSESISQKTHRTIAGLDTLKEMIGPMTSGKIAGIGIALAAGFTALNIISGDGTPEDINDIPSVNNPSFSNPRYGQRAAYQLNSPANANISMNLITDNRSNFDDTIQSISAMQAGRQFNTVSVRSDGTDPYKSDYYQYTQ